MATFSIQNEATLTYASGEALVNDDNVVGKPFAPGTAEQKFTVLRTADNTYTITMNAFIFSVTTVPADPSDNINVILNNAVDESGEWTLEAVTSSTYRISRADAAGVRFYWTLDAADGPIRLQQLRAGAQASTQHWVLQGI